jgi:hypothetical protein
MGFHLIPNLAVILFPKQTVIPGFQQTVIPSFKQTVMPSFKQTVIPGSTRDPPLLVPYLSEEEKMGAGFRRDDGALFLDLFALI